MLFVLGCFPSRGLYFLLHPATPDGRYYAHQSVLSAPASRTPKLKASKVPLPARLSRMPRTVKTTPVATAPDHRLLFTLTPDEMASHKAASPPFFPPYQAHPSAPPPSRAPPASV